MKRSIVLKLWRVLLKLETMRHDIEFSYFLAKNKVALKKEIEELEKTQTPSNSFIEFENKRIELAQKFSDKDDGGNPKVNNGQYVICDRSSEFSEEVKKLKETFKSAIESREEQIKNYSKMLDEDVNVVLFKIKLAQFPRQMEPTFLEVFIEANVIDEG